MKKVLVLILTVLMVFNLTCSAWAASETNEKELHEVNGVYIPADAECILENGAEIYNNFYDPINDMNYSFYNAETGEHFAISGPQYETIGNGARATLKVVHNYSFKTSNMTDGSINQKFFTLPANKVYIYGTAEVVHAGSNSSDDEFLTDYYPGGIDYSIEISEDTFWFPNSKTFSTTAGEYIYETFTMDAGTYYMVINVLDHLESWHTLKGSGQLYYYG